MENRMESEKRIIVKFRSVDHLKSGKYRFSVFTTSHNEQQTAMKKSKIWENIVGHETISLDLGKKSTRRVVLFIILHKNYFWKTGQVGRFQLILTETFTRDFWHERSLSLHYFDQEEERKTEVPPKLNIRVKIENFGAATPLCQYPLYVLFSPEYQYDGILREILSYLTATDMYRSISMLSKYLWCTMKSVKMSDQLNIPVRMKTIEFAAFLGRYNNFSNIRLEGYVFQDFEVSQAPHLTRLSIGTVHRDSPIGLLHVCPNLTHLFIDRISHERRWEDLVPILNIDCEISDFVERPTKQKLRLRVLKVFSADNIDILGDVFMQFLEQCPDLETISCPYDFFFQDFHQKKMLQIHRNRLRHWKEEKGEEGKEPIKMDFEVVKDRVFEEYFMDYNGLHWIIEYREGVPPMYEDFVIFSPRFDEEDRTCFVTRVRITSKSEDDGLEIRREFVFGFSSESDSFKVLRFSKKRSCRVLRVQIELLEMFSDLEEYEKNTRSVRVDLLKDINYPIRANHELDLSRENLDRFETLYNGDLVLQSDVWLHSFLFRISVTYDPRCRRFTVYVLSLHAREYVVSCAIRLVFNGTKREIDHAVFDGRGGYGWNDLLEDEESQLGSSRMHLFFVIHRIFNRDEYRFYVKEKFQRWSKIRNIFFNKDAQLMLINESKSIGVINRSSSPPPSVVRDVFHDEKTKKTLQLFHRPEDSTVFEAQRVMFELYGIRWVLSFHPNRGKFGRSAFFLRCEDLMGSYIMRIRWSLRGDCIRNPLLSTVQDYFQDRVWGFDEVHIRRQTELNDGKSSPTQVFEVEVEVEILEVFPEDKYFAGQQFIREQIVCNKKGEITLEIQSKGVENPIQTDNFVVCGVPFMLEFYVDGLESRDKITAILYHRMEIHYIITGNYQVFCKDENGVEYASAEVVETDEHAIKFSNICDKNLLINWRVRVVVELKNFNCHSQTLPSKQHTQYYSK